MSVSMLLNAANVVKAAERCKAIDETNGRIPINFLLSRSNDLDDQVKHQLQQLAVSSPSISLNSMPPVHPPPPDAPLTPTSATQRLSINNSNSSAAAATDSTPADHVPGRPQQKQSNTTTTTTAITATTTSTTTTTNNNDSNSRFPSSSTNTTSTTATNITSSNTPMSLCPNPSTTTTATTTAHTNRGATATSSVSKHTSTSASASASASAAGPPSPPPLRPTSSLSRPGMAVSSRAPALNSTTAAAAGDDRGRGRHQQVMVASESLPSLCADELAVMESETDEEAALRDIDDASMSQAARPDRKLLRLGKQQNGRLTRKAIRKHSAAVQPSAMLHIPLLPPRHHAPVDGSSTIHTTSAASQPSVSSSLSGGGVRRMPMPSNFPTFNGRRDMVASVMAAAVAAGKSAAGGVGGGNHHHHHHHHHNNHGSSNGGSDGVMGNGLSNSNHHHDGMGPAGGDAVDGMDRGEEDDKDNEDCENEENGMLGGGNGKMPRRRWKAWEDELLIQVVSEHGPSRWNTLARHFPGRNGRQVRLRWMNHLQPSLDKRPWRADEDAVLMEAHQALGNKWALISMRLCGRTDNSVKNRYKSIVRRAAREAKARRS